MECSFADVKKKHPFQLKTSNLGSFIIVKLNLSY